MKAFGEKQRQLIWAVLCMLVLLGGVSLGRAIISNRMLLSMHFCSTYEDVMGKEQESPDLDIRGALLFNGFTAPYAMSLNTFYISQDTSVDGWKGAIRPAEGWEIYFLLDEMWLHKNHAIAINYNYSVLIKKDDQYRSANLVVSGLPVLALNSVSHEENTPDKITLLGPDAETSYEGFCTFHMRGASSKEFPKFGYKIELCDERFDPVDFPLLGLRSDDDWIINALYGDSSKIREKMAYQIWEEMQEYNQTKDRSSNITHIELVFEDIYWGIYGLQEPVDKKQLSMSETDYFFRKPDTAIPTEEEFLVEDGQTTIPGFELKYPKSEDVKAEDWLVLQPYVDVFYSDIYSPSKEVEDMETLTSLLDISNALDYEIFIAVIAGYDNTLKNIDYCLRYENGQYRMHVIPWDLNWSFGDDWMLPNATYHPEIAVADMVKTWEYIALYQADHELVEEAVREKWFAYRESFLDTEHLRRMAEEYMAELAASGALYRDYAKWPECEGSADLTEIYDYIDRHMEYLDSYFGEDEWWQRDEELRRAGQ